MAKLPGRRSKTPLMTEEQKAFEQKFGRCPKGHQLPHRTNKGICTAVFCAGASSGAPSKKKSRRTEVVELREEVIGAATQPIDAPTAPNTALAPVDSDLDTHELTEVANRITKAKTRHQARMAYVKLPVFKDQKEIELHVEAKKMELLPLALADVEYQLKLGDAQEREKARKEVLDMTGHGKQDGKSGPSTPQIIIIGAGTDAQSLPWVRRVDPSTLPAGVTINEEK